MSLRKSPTLTPALLKACRRNAKKSKGPRTAQGKANVRMNALRQGGRSQVWEDFALTVFYAPPGGVERTVRALLTTDLARHQAFAQYAEIAIEADMPEEERLRSIQSVLRRKPKRDSLFSDEQTGNVIENKGSKKWKP